MFANVAQIPKNIQQNFAKKEEKKKGETNLSGVTYHLSHITCHMSPVTPLFTVCWIGKTDTFVLGNQPLYRKTPKRFLNKIAQNFNNKKTGLFVLNFSHTLLTRCFQSMRFQVQAHGTNTHSHWSTDRHCNLLIVNGSAPKGFGLVRWFFDRVFISIFKASQIKTFIIFHDWFKRYVNVKWGIVKRMILSGDEATYVVQTTIN